MAYDLGDPVTLAIEIRDATNALADATSVTVTITLPDGSTATPAVAHPSTGAYSTVYLPPLRGWYVANWVATGANAGAHVQQFEVGAPLTFDPTTTIGRVRLLATDIDPSAPLFSDAQITAFLALEGQDVRLAAAQALDTIASSEALVSKKVRTADGLATDGPAVAAELRARAQQLREQVADGAGLTGGDDSAFQVVTFDWS